METASATATESGRAARGCSRTRQPSEIFTPEKLSDEHRLMAQTTDEFVDTEVLPKLEQLEAKDWELARRADPPVRRARPARRQRARRSTAASISTRSRRSSSPSASRAPRRSRRPSAARPTCASCRSSSSAPTRRSRSTCRGSSAGELVGAYALSESGSGSDALAAQDARHRAAGRQLDAQRREDVDHQRRLRRRHHRLRQGRRRALHGLHRREERSPASAPARKSTRWGCTARRRRRSCCRTRRCRRRMCSARSARATRSRSTR